jgi:glycosyltransferase involved in cell wall biosynthesis
LRICFFILNSFEPDSRAKLICSDILSMGWQLDIVATTGGSITNYGGAPIHAIPQSTWPSRKRRFIEYNIRAAAIGKKLKADIYHAVDLDTLWAATKAAKFCNGKVLYESRELYTELLALSGRPIIKNLWRLLEMKTIRRADAVVTINEPIAEELARRYSIKTPEIVMNVAALSSPAKPIDLRNRFNLAYKQILVYQGILRPGQGILLALELLAHLPETGLVIIGSGPLEAEIKTKITELSLSDRVRLAGRVLPEELAAYTQGADAGLLLMEPLALNNRLALPQKIFQYIAATVPPIVSDLPCLRKIVESDNLGLVLKDSTLAEKSMAIKMFLDGGLDNAKKRCLEASKKYCWEIEGKKLIEIYKGLMG